MKQTERYEDEEEALRAALLGLQASIWTALPCIVESFDAEKQTCTLQPAIQGIRTDKEGEQHIEDMPLLVDVPVYRFRGKGFSVTVPIEKGDEGLVVFSSRCIDTWWQNGGVQPQFESRLHDLSDGFFFPGFNSQTKNLEDFATDAVEVRTDAGDVKIAVKADEIDVIVKDETFVKLLDKEVHLKAGDSTIDMTNDLIDINATEIKLNGIVWGTHEHTGVQAGGAKTGGPVAP